MSERSFSVSIDKNEKLEVGTDDTRNVGYGILGHSFPLPRILESLKKYNCTHIDSNNWQFTYYDEIIEACGKAFDMKLDMKYRSQQEIQRLLYY